jgi:hypothetical protein
MHDSYFTVYNLSSSRLKLFHDLFNDIDFNGVYDIIKKEKLGNRGNYQQNFGFSTLNILGRDEETLIRIPKPIKNNKIVIDNLIKMSSILQLMSPFPDKMQSIQQDRIERFAKKIHPSNLLEGLTYAYTIIESDDCSDPQTFNCHVDRFSSEVNPFNYLTIAGAIKYINQKWIRLSITGYGRKSVDDYYTRVATFSPILNKINEYYTKLPIEQKT